MKFRYRNEDEMKDSGVDWLGIIPKEWNEIKAKWLFSNSNEKGLKEDILLSATQDRGVIPKVMVVGAVQNREDADLSNFKLVKKFDFIISLRSFQGGFEMSEYGRGVITPAYSVLRSKTNINSYYFKYLLKEMKFINKINSLTTGIRDGKSVRYEEFCSVMLPVPALDKQNIIAKFLREKIDQFDNIISKKEDLIKRLEEAKKSLISEVVTGKVKVVKTESRYELEERKKEEMKDSGVGWLGDIPSDWRTNKLSNICTIGDGLHGTPIYCDSSDYYFINGNNLVGKFIKIKDKTPCVPEEEYVRNYINLNENTILISLNGSVGKISYYRCESIILSKSVGYINVYASIFKEFLYYYLLSDNIGNYFELSFMGTTIKNLSLQTIRNMKVIIPNITKQKQIVEYLDKHIEEIDEIILKSNIQVEKLKEAKKSLISEAVTGKIEIFDN